MEEKFTVSKVLVFDEVAKVTAYIGAKKMPENSSAYETISVTDADYYLLEDYFDEVAPQVDELLKPYLVNSVKQDPGHGVDLSKGKDYEATVHTHSLYDTNNTTAIKTLLFNFFVSMVLVKWLCVASPEEAEQYANKSAGIATAIKNKLMYKTKPERIVPIK